MTAENYDWKNAFKRNRVKIVKGLANPDEVASELFQLKIFNTEMVETILQTNEKEQKTRTILDTLNYRGEKGVSALHEAFLETDNERLAKDLAPYVIAVEKIENKTEPKAWPPSTFEEEEMRADHVMTITNAKSPWFIHEYGKDYVYNMQGENRGKVFIINNVKFDKPWSERDGSNMDAENLSKLFQELHFTVQQWDNLTANDMQSNLSNAANELKENTECVILIILSHGGGTRVYGVDLMPVQLKTLTDCFSSARCPTLREKPRLVFVQACRSVEIASIEKTTHRVKQHEDVEIECNIKTENPILEVSWMKDGSKTSINVDSSTNKYLIGSMKSLKCLTVKNVEHSDKGKYNCIVKYESEYRSNPSELKLDVKDVEIASIQKTIYSAKPGTPKIKIDCVVRTDKPIEKVVWEKDVEGENGVTYINHTKSDKYQLSSTKSIQSLIIKNVKASDKGQYRCIINYGDGSKDLSNHTELEVDLQGVTIAKIEETIHIAEPGGQVEIKCVVGTKETVIKVVWEKDAGDIKHLITEETSPNKYCVKQEKGLVRLIIKKVEISDIGKYRCIVKYESEYSSNPTELVMEAKKDAERDIKDIGKKPGDELDSVPDQQTIKEDKSPKPTILDHPASDFLVAYATPEGAIAYRHGEVGSWFMNAIVWTFKYHAHEEELHHLLIRQKDFSKQYSYIACSQDNI